MVRVKLRLKFRVRFRVMLRVRFRVMVRVNPYPNLSPLRWVNAGP